MYVPTFSDVLQAKKRIRPYLPPTPLHHYPALDKLIGVEIYIKHENYQPIGAFKIRGGINLVSQLDEDTRQRGLITASTGNHGQSISRAGQMFGAAVRIVVPEGANPGKVAAMQGMGAEVIFFGEKFDDARHHAGELSEQHGYRYVHPCEEPHIIAGVATQTLEMLEAQPDLDTIILPIGSGSGATGACIVAKAINPAIRVIGVQSSAAPAAYESWKAGTVIAVPNHTFAEGIATGVGFEYTQRILADHLDDFILVGDDEIRQAMVRLLEYAHTLAEGAGAAPLAAIEQRRTEWRNRKIGMICSGGNVSLANLQAALAHADQRTAINA